MMRRVVRWKFVPGDGMKAWHLTLDCGHERTVSAAYNPAPTTVSCAECEEVTDAR